MDRLHPTSPLRATKDYSKSSSSQCRCVDRHMGHFGLTSFTLWSEYPDFPFGYDHEAALPLIDTFRLENLLYACNQILPAGGVQTNQKKARGRSRSELADIREFHVLRH